jgi:fatty acid desaturase
MVTGACPREVEGKTPERPKKTSTMTPASKTYAPLKAPPAPAALPRLLAAWPTLLLLLLSFALMGTALLLPEGAGWAAFLLLVPALTLHSSLSHEILHGHACRGAPGQCLLALFQPGLLVPFLRFRALHLDHHRDERLTDPYDDPESNFLDPAHWSRLAPAARRLLAFNNTLLGRILLGPALGTWAFLRDDLRRLGAGETRVALHWALHLPGVLLTLWLVGHSALPLWLYLLACYGAAGVLKIRTFLEHRAHEASAGRSVVIEDRGLLALLFLNNNFHAVHHRFPGVPWYRLPALYRAERARILAENDHYLYRSYGEVFRAHLLRAKDPVAHPLWRG